MKPITIGYHHCLVRNYNSKLQKLFNKSILKIPFLDEMLDNHRTVMLPTIDVIDHDTFEFKRQNHHNLYASRGVFDWTFKYKLVPLLPSTVARISKPFETPVMAGGLFAITATFFWELGAYDNGLDTYGELNSF